MGKTITQESCANVLVVATTPRLPDGQVDLEGCRGNVEFLIDNGVDYIMPQCGTGLVYDSTLAEFEAVVGAFVEAAAGRAFIVPGIGPGYGRSLEMGHIAQGLQVAGVMIMPIVGPASARGAYNGLKSIVEKVQLSTVLYQRRLDIMPVDEVVELCAIDAVVGLKYAVDDLDSFKRINDRAGGQAAMVCGMAEDPCIDYMAAGAVGFSSGMANFVPRMSLTILRAFAGGQRQRAEQLRQQMVPFEDFRGERGARYSGSALHAAMEVAGLAGGPVIPFAEDVDPGDRPRVETMMKALLATEKILREEV
ncbi:MAG: hypothetical protein GKR89_16335 [Candidatus Latescibacteria bacterium]|nr:hypothetical protein [Candidatus Latescibacterota bacterium]